MTSWGWKRQRAGGQESRAERREGGACGQDRGAAAASSDPLCTRGAAVRVPATVSASVLSGSPPSAPQRGKDQAETHPHAGAASGPATWEPEQASSDLTPSNDLQTRPQATSRSWRPCHLPPPAMRESPCLTAKPSLVLCRTDGCGNVGGQARTVRLRCYRHAGRGIKGGRTAPEETLSHSGTFPQTALTRTPRPRLSCPAPPSAWDRCDSTLVHWWKS